MFSIQYPKLGSGLCSQTVRICYAFLSSTIFSGGFTTTPAFKRDDLQKEMLKKIFKLQTKIV